MTSSRIWLPPHLRPSRPLRPASRRSQRGFIIDPFRLGGATDPHFASVQLLLHGDGTNGGTTFTDSSSAARTPTNVVGGIVTASDGAAFGGSAISFASGNTANYIEYAPGSNFLSSTSQNFTIECWIDLASQLNNGSGYAAGSHAFLTLLDSTTRRLTFSASGFGAADIIVDAGGASSYTLPSGNRLTRFHFAYTRNGGTSNAWADGVAFGTGGNFNFDRIVIGNPVWLSNYTVGGTIEEVRLTVGVARYAGASFTPPVAAFPDA